MVYKKVPLKMEDSKKIYFSPHKEGHVEKIKTPPHLLFTCN